jgi:hypothetical protein
VGRGVRERKREDVENALILLESSEWNEEREEVVSRE